MLDVQLDFGRRKMPTILQSEAAECGLACLAMIASHHGFRTDLATLRGRFSLSLKGTTLEQLITCAEQLKLAGRALRLEIDELAQLNMPCILHWRMSHFVVLERADAKGAVIHDPALGVRRLGYDEIEEAFTGIALELSPGIDFTPADERRRVSLAALLGKVRGLWQTLAMVFVMALALESLALGAPILQQWVTDEALVSGDRDMLNVLTCAALLMMVTQAAISQWRGWTLLYLSTTMSMQWNAAIFTHLLRLPVAWFEKRHLGDVVSRFGAAGAIQRKLTTGFISAVLDGLMAAITLVMMFVYSATLASVVLVSALLYALLRVVAYAPLREASMEGMILGAQEQSCFLETIRAVQAIKLAGREIDRRTRWLNLLAQSVNRGIRTQKLGLVFGNLHLAVTGIVGALVFRIGAGMIMDGTGFTIGMLIAFVSYSGQFGTRIAALIDNAIEWKMLSLQCERLADIVLEQPEAEGADYPQLASLPARIELVDVAFRYGDAEPWVLRHVNLVIEPGESLALVGPSGGGKTTLIKLILGTLQPIEGEVRYGGVPIARIGARAYRTMLAAVMQDDQLLAGSLRDNITFFDQQPDMRRIEQCAQRAAIHDAIMAMPMGYNTLSGDMGSSLSGGQKQRILLARALYKEPKVLMLDEATSHLDVAMERAVNGAIAALPLTRIIVAHRPETIASAARVVVLSGGSIVRDMKAPATGAAVTPSS
jgi:ATP-binding cassette subfamily B protein RaxB